MHEDLLRDEREALLGTLIRRPLESIRLRIRRVIDAGHERSEPAALDRLARRERQRSKRSPVERAEKRDDALAFGEVARELQRRLGRLGTGVAEKRPHV